MTLAMCCHIVFHANERRDAVELRQVSRVEISSNVQDVCQSAAITLPRNIPAFINSELKTLIRRGDAVSIYLGYDGDLRVVEFSGLATRVGADVPVVIECRDRLWKVLQEPFHKAYKDAWVPDVVKDLVGDAFHYEAMDARLGPMRVVKGKKGDVFKALKDEFGLVTYLKGDTLFCGVLFDTNSRTATYALERNVKSSDLVYRTADEVSLKVTATSIKRDGSKIEAVVGDPDGETRTLNYYGITSKEELEKIAKVDMEKFKYDGYEGGLKGFGIPVCQHGDKVELVSYDHPERNGTYLAESVNITFGPEGFERDIKLAQQWTA